MVRGWHPPNSVDSVLGPWRESEGFGSGHGRLVGRKLLHSPILGATRTCHDLLNWVLDLPGVHVTVVDLGELGGTGEVVVEVALRPVADLPGMLVHHLPRGLTAMSTRPERRKGATPLAVRPRDLRTAPIRAHINSRVGLPAYPGNGSHDANR
jgi:hypothetical protein